MLQCSRCLTSLGENIAPGETTFFCRSCALLAPKLDPDGTRSRELPIDDEYLPSNVRHAISMEKDLSKALKFDAEKTRLDLFPPEALEEIGKVLTHGAKKYTTYGECTCSSVWIAQSALENIAENVERVTKNGSKNTTPRMQSVNELIHANGGEKIENTYEATVANGINSTQRNDTASLLQKLNDYLKGVAPSVREKIVCALITHIKPEKQEWLCASLATLESAGLKIKNGSIKHASICDALKIIQVGEHNWAKGLDWSRLHGALLRHLNAWAAGEDYDAESGLRHLAHAGCCVAFLIAHDVNKLGNDDRRKTKKSEAK